MNLDQVLPVQLVSFTISIRVTLTSIYYDHGRGGLLEVYPNSSTAIYTFAST